MMDNDKKDKCPICQGTGFAKGGICLCITGKLPDGLPDFMDVFCDIFATTKDPSGGKRSGKD